MAIDKDIEGNSGRVGMISNAIRVGIFPPWLIETFKDQVRASIWIIAVDCVLLFVDRSFAPFSNADLSTFSILMNVGVSVVPIVLAIFVNAFFPRRGEETLKKWINFLSVSFLYCLFAIFLAVALPSILPLPGHPVNWLEGLLGTAWALRSLAAGAAVLSIAFMYWRMRRQFRTPAKQTPGLLVFAFLVCWAGLAALSYFAVFTDF
jgi:hypothetical protein